jgi:hypothetical protein
MEAPSVSLTEIIKDNIFWEQIINSKLNNVKKMIEHLLSEFGTSQPCNRFDVGNTIEFILNDHIEDSGFKVNELPNAKRFDVDVKNYKKLSIKYSSGGEITLHNSNSCVNTDLEMKDTILLTPERLYLITNEELLKHKIDIKEYLKNAGDSLKLKRSILKTLKIKNYPYIYDINIAHDKQACKHRLCSKLFYKEFLSEFSELNN